MNLHHDCRLEKLVARLRHCHPPQTWPGGIHRDLGREQRVVLASPPHADHRRRHDQSSELAVDRWLVHPLYALLLRGICHLAQQRLEPDLNLG